jgi:DNA-binding GntR family transcriptional regulator
VTSSPPTYLRIAADIRTRIASGDLQPGDKLPSAAKLSQAYGCHVTSIRTALAKLQSEGLIERRRGSGTYVREATRLERRAHARNLRLPPGGSPFGRDVAAAGGTARWEHRSEHITATVRIAQRLAIDPGTPVMHTRYRYLADDQPIQLAESWEPLSITAGTAVEWPEAGAAVGVVARMDLIGVPPDRFVEVVTPRPASPQEIDDLGLDQRAGLWVLAIERTYYAGNTPVETADIALPADRYRVIYEVPIDPTPE